MKADTTLYLIGGAVALGIAAYFLLRPKPAYAAPGVPGLPGPGVPPSPEVSGFELPVGSWLAPVNPVLWENNIRHVRYLKGRTPEASLADYGSSMNVWIGQTDAGGVSDVWFSLPQIAGIERVEAVFGPDNTPVWVPAMGPLKDYR